MIRHGLGSTDDRQVLKFAELYFKYFNSKMGTIKTITYTSV